MFFRFISYCTCMPTANYFTNRFRLCQKVSAMLIKATKNETILDLIAHPIQGIKAPHALYRIKNSLLLPITSSLATLSISSNNLCCIARQVLFSSYIQRELSELNPINTLLTWCPGGWGWGDANK